MKSPEQEDEGSASQMQWTIIANTVRETLEERLERLKTMSSAETIEFIRALNDALTLESSARAFDLGVEKKYL